MVHALQRVGMVGIVFAVCGAALGEPPADTAALRVEVAQLREQLVDTQLLLRQAAKELQQLRTQIQQQDRTEQQAEWSAQRQAARDAQSAVRREEAAIQQQRAALKQLARLPEKQEAPTAGVPGAVPAQGAAPPATGPLVQQPPYSVWNGWYSRPSDDGYGYGWGWPWGYAVPPYGYGGWWGTGPGWVVPRVEVRPGEIRPGPGTTLFNGSSRGMGGGTTLFNGGIR